MPDRRARAARSSPPAGFERFFAELVAMGGVLAADPEQLGALTECYGLDMRGETVPELVERLGVVLGEDLYASAAAS